MTEPTPRRYWNTVSGTAAVLSLLWVGACVAFVKAGVAPFELAAASAGPVLGMWIGLLVQIAGGKN